MSSLFDNQVPLMKPWLDEEEWYAMKDVILSGWVSQGPKVKEFEQKVAAYIGVKHAVAMNACTSAMHIAMKIAGVKYGDEVIVADSTCMANVNAINMAGAVPVFVDIDPDTYNIDPKLIEAKITSKTKVIMNIDQIGLSNDLDALKAICDKHNLTLLDDAATAFGGKYKGKFLGNHNVMATYSFHPRKMITTGEGGMLVTDNDDIAEQARILRATGASVSDLDRHKAKGLILQKYYDSGYNYRMTDMQAAMGIVQLTKIDAMLEQRKYQAEYYNQHLAAISDLQLPFVPEYADPAWSSYCIKIKPESKKTVQEVLQTLAAANISARFGIQPLHQEPYFENQNYKDEDFPVSCTVADQTFFVPIYPGMTEQQQQHIVQTLKQIFQS
ncbi:DegT/DnrJ/EryC1/StrS family aminotransferase [Taibaiella lutea]|uniref:DegT/DnrJ/EryC1/StrS family aminotransferase n=1 Tax=Taibaiella lutea TaxID=2608001 RepID=A0A5M6CEG5_9BACT|nr:DegT/DnrJ/EryC1/StrS family aminotransferase [Taibaiella lutea]KAA5533373.1 DegT/DnrJ/EryC1/StrS family aminotransferase [Taibaiella lutea]